MLTICETILEEMISLAIQNYPNEACGILTGAKGQNSVSRFIPCRNIYDEMHARFPESYPRTAKTAFLIDPLEQQRLLSEADREGLEVKAIFHSHTDHDAYFSEEDRLVAAPWGEPMYPGVSYIVVSIENRKFKEANEYHWDEQKKDFIQGGSYVGSY